MKSPRRAGGKEKQMDCTIRILIPEAISGKSKYIERQIIGFERTMKSYGIDTKIYVEDCKTFCTADGKPIEAAETIEEAKKKGFWHEITHFFFGRTNPLVTKVSFEMPYPCWCKLENSDAWRCLVEAASCIRKGQEP